MSGSSVSKRLISVCASPYPPRHWKFLAPAASGRVAADFIAAPFHGGQPKVGTHRGPQALLDNGLLGQLNALGWDVGYDPAHAQRVWDLNPKPKLGSEADFHTNVVPRNAAGVALRETVSVGAASLEVANAIQKAHRNGKLALTVGGDHSIGLGTLFGTLQTYPDAVVVWVDAHADINTPESTPSGNLHGCVLSFLLGLHDSSKIPGFEWMKKLLTPDRLVYIGVRDIDDGERKILRDNGIKAFSMHQVDKYGIGQAVEKAIQAVNPNLDKPIHLSFDVDALDPIEVASTGTPVRGGLTFREGHYVCEALAETGNLVSVDLMEVNPELGTVETAKNTVNVGCSLIRCALGETLL